MASKTHLHAALAALPLLAACTTSGDSLDESQEAISEAKCTTFIKGDVLKNAFKISDTARILESRRIYGDASTAREVRLVRVSDETDPSDYIVVRSRLKNGVSDPETCAVESMTRVADGMVPEALIAGKLGVSCTALISSAVLVKAKKLDGAATIAGTKLIYGGDDSYGGATIVRVSGKKESTDYVAIFSLDGSVQQGKGECTVDLASPLHSGDLPEVAGLPNAPAPGCTGPDGVSHKVGESFTRDCNACTCEAGGASCTEVVCGPPKQTCVGPKGETYAVGQSFKRDCNTCTCEAGGASCTEVVCGP